MPGVEKQLQAVTKVRQKSGEKTKIYLQRLVRAAVGLKEDHWVTLSNEAQEWVQRAHRLIKQKRGPPPFPGETELPDIDLPVPPSKQALSRSAASAHAKDHIFDLLLHNPHVTVNQLREMVQQDGVSVGGHNTCPKWHGAFRDVMAYLAKKGLLTVKWPPKVE